MLRFWEQNRIFDKLREQNANGPRWSFLDGPITANNPMGVHHAWGRSLKDMYQRYHAMNGRAERYQNGFDCQGLWVEVEVEKSLGLKTKREIRDYGIEKFVRACKERVLTYAARQTEQSIRHRLACSRPNHQRGADTRVESRPTRKMPGRCEFKSDRDECESHQGGNLAEERGQSRQEGQQCAESELPGSGERHVERALWIDGKKHDAADAS